jgi:hypothetical protein
MAEPLPPHVLALLRDAIGLHNPDPRDPLHVRLVNTVLRMQRAPLGQVLVALKFEFNWEHVQAGKDYAQMKADLEHLMDRETVALRVVPSKITGKLPSRVEAEQIVRASDAYYQLNLRYLLAEKREQSMRKFLETLSSALDNHRTDRADWRSSDQAHRDGLAGGA